MEESVFVVYDCAAPSQWISAVFRTSTLASNYLKTLRNIGMVTPPIIGGRIEQKAATIKDNRVYIIDDPFKYGHRLND